MAEMVNVDRPSDDGEEHDPSAADELEEITLSETRERPKSKFHFDLDLSPEAVDPTTIDGEFVYPEWDFRKGRYLADHCRVVAGTPSGDTDRAIVSDAALVRKVRRQFETLRPKRELRRAQLDGEQIDHLPASQGAQARVEPIYVTLEGWKESTVGARSWADLPAQAIKYVRQVEELIGAPVALLSTSPERDDTILVTDPFED